MQGTEYDPIFSKEEVEILAEYVSDPSADIFVFLPSLYGVGGAVFARYSRAAGGARVRLLKEFLDEKGKLKLDKLNELVERVLIAYGDDSVGELENAHLALENVSNLATKEIEDCRIGLSPIEQSSRYVVYDQRDRQGRLRYLRPVEVVEAGLLSEYETTLDYVLETYIQLIQPMSEYFKRLKPENEAEYAVRAGDSKAYKLQELDNDKERRAWSVTYKTDIKTKTCDTLRGLLPAATLTNVGISGNGRGYQNMLTKLKSHDLVEFQDLGDRAKGALSVVIENYVKRGNVNFYLRTVNEKMEEIAHRYLGHIESVSRERVELFYGGNWNFESMAIAHILYPFSCLSLGELYDFSQLLTFNQKKAIMEAYCQHKDVRGNRRNKPGRGLEFGYPITFDFVGDFGIYRDLERQRMLTQQRQLLNPYLGYVTPEEVIEAGLGKQFRTCVERSYHLYDKLLVSVGKKVAQYAVLFLFNIRWYMGMNHREAFHLMELRTIPQGHPSYRKLIQKAHRLLCEQDLLIAPLMEFVDYNDYFWSRAESEAAQRRKENRIVS
ncbi:MAG: FAD-dependent thymidylate synthase [Parcubacteria group bacterium]|nr:FAD-dependent thymidylate synthase [Parcubacteria group bacterium]